VYTVGLSISEQPLTATVGVALSSGEFDPLILKGTPLPAKKRSTYRNTIDVLPTDNRGAIRIPFVQGEDRRACRNSLIGTLEILPDKAGRPVPVGSEVEVFLEVDGSQTFHVKVYVPVLDEEFPAKYLYHRPTPDLQKLREEYENELERLDALREQARGTEEKDVQAHLSALEDQDLLNDIERLLTAAEADRDALERAQRKLLDFQLTLDAVEEALNWPTLVKQANEEVQMARQVLEGAGKDEDKREAREIERELKAALQARDADVVRNRIEALSRVRFRVLARDPGFWVGWFQWCGEHKDELRDPAVGAKLLARGNRALQNNDLDGLKAVVRQLICELPEQKKQQITKGLGSTLMKAE